MRNRIVGIMVIGIALLIGFIIFSFNRALTSIVNETCTHGETCAMWGTIDFQTNIGIGIMAFIILVGIYLVFFGREEKIITKIRMIKPQVGQVEPKKITKENYKDVMKDLDDDEKSVFEKIIESEGSIFQSELVEKTSMPKVKITRVLDKLEGKGLIERKRRGMTNIVILKG
ncbi:MAG: MarR family transcriptional regulator [Nanoarchaeota archaeon]|nr:MarR family transcriptional regulator [Nanoarchaeota archaeon]